MKYSVEDLISEEEKKIANSEESIISSRKKIELLKKGKKINKYELYVILTSINSETTKGKGITYGVGKDSYNFILGGDGRSQPWDERREGIVCTVKIDCIMDYDLTPILVRYMKEVIECDHVIIIDCLNDRYDRN